MRVKRRLFWYFGGHLPRRAVAAMTAQPEQLLQQMTETELACWEGPYCAAHTHTCTCTCTHATWIPTVVRVNIYRPRSSSEREEWTVCAGSGAGETRERRGVIFPTRSGKLERGGRRAFVEECVGVGGWGGCQRKREGSNRAEAANLQSGTEPMSSYWMSWT